MTTKNKLKALQNTLLSDDMLESVLDWVRDNYTPDEVFDEDVLMEWAEENGYVLEEDIDYISWAEENGYILEEDCDCDCPECDCDD